MTASVIGTDLAIVGERITIISQHALQIDEDIRADISGRAVVIGEEGSVVGTISAEIVDVRGGVRGAIRGRSVTLRSSAQVEGKSRTTTIAEAPISTAAFAARSPDLAVELDASAVAARLPKQGAAWAAHAARWLGRISACRAGAVRAHADMPARGCRVDEPAPRA